MFAMLKYFKAKKNKILPLELWEILKYFALKIFDKKVAIELTSVMPVNSFLKWNK